MSPLVALYLLSGPAWAQDEEADREADLFGGSEEEDLEDDLFSGPEDEGQGDREAPTSQDDRGLSADLAQTEASMLSKLADAEDALTIGGRLWLRFNGSLSQGTDGLEDVAIASPNLLDLFADARPNDRVRAYVRARLQHDWTVVDGEQANPFLPPATQDEVLLDQLWIKFDVDHKLYATVGRQRLKWGAGRFWNPTDFMNQQRLDPLAVQDLRTGTSLVKLHIPFEAAGANLYALANLEQANALDEIGGAMRLEWLIGQTELTTSAAVRKNDPIRLGADVSSGISVFDVHLEGAVIHGDEHPYWRGRMDFSNPLDIAIPTEVDRSGDWIPQVVAGAEVSAKYSAEDAVSFGAEYFFNDAGYENARLYPWMFFTGTYSPFYVGRHYIAGYAYLPGPGEWDDHSFTASYLANLSDRSQTARLDYRGTVLTRLNVNAFAGLNFGGNGEFHYRLAIDPVPGAELFLQDTELAALGPALEAGITVPAPTAYFGTGLEVRF